MAKLFYVFFFILCIFEGYSLNLTQEEPLSYRYNDEINLYEDDQLYNIQRLIIGRRREDITPRKWREMIIFDFLPTWNRFPYEEQLNQVMEDTKRGCFKLKEEDFAVPTVGSNRLKFMRYYNSFSDKDYGFGKGWDYVPVRIIPFANEKNILLTFEGKERKIYFDKEDENFIYFQARKQNIPVRFDKKSRRYILQSKFNTWTLDEKGNLLLAEDSYHNKITYGYENDKLKEIASALYRIVIEYNEDRVAAIQCKNIRLQYFYDKNKQLIKRKQNNAECLYQYDKKNRLKEVKNQREGTTFIIGYDSAGFVKTVRYPGLHVTRNAKKQSIVVSFNKMHTYLEKYDTYFRPIHRSSQRNQSIHFTYEEQGPDMTVHFVNQENMKRLCRYDQYNRLRRFWSFDATAYKARINDQWEDVPIDQEDLLGEFFYYDINNNLTEWLSEYGALQQYKYNDKHQMVLAYNDGGIRESCTSMPEKLEENHIYYKPEVKKGYAYNKYGYLFLITSAMDHKHYFQYEKHGILIKYTFPSGRWIQKIMDNRLRYQKMIIQTGDKHILQNEDALDRILKREVIH